MDTARFTFENYEVDAKTKATYEAFKSMANPDAPPLLLVHGDVGNGKSHLAHALSNALYCKGIYVKVLYWSDIVNLWQQSFNDPELNFYKLFDRFRKAERLILDDVGMGTTGSNWEWGRLEDVTRYRYDEMLFTVMITNKTLDEMPPRIVSRFADPQVGRVVMNAGGDYRRRWLRGNK